MSENYMEKRKHPRVEAKVKISFRSMQELTHEYTRNISTGGIFLKTDRLLDPNAVIELDIQFPDQLGLFQVKGKVVRLMTLSHPEDPKKLLYGVGVKFLDPPAAMVGIIDKIISMNASLKK